MNVTKEKIIKEISDIRNKELLSRLQQILAEMKRLDASKVFEYATVIKEDFDLKKIAKEQNYDPKDLPSMIGCLEDDEESAEDLLMLLTK